MAKKKKFWSSEKLMSVAAVFISLLTLAVFLYQTNLIKKQQYMSVFPYLEIGNAGSGSDSYEFYIENKGIGPALLTDVILSYKKKPLDKSLQEFVTSKTSDKDSFYFQYSSIYSGRLISPNESIPLIYNTDKNENSADRLYEIINDSDFEFIIEYQSIYEEKWRIRKGATGTLKLD
jgi:hypothetical protein